MDERGLTQVRVQLEDFAAGVFAGLPRSDQRATGLRYLRGLMLDGQRKSMQPMAERLGVDYQQVQQFVTSSTWDVAGVRRRLAAIAVDVVGPRVWVVDDTGFPKDGKASPCVARQYSGTLGKVANCQIAVSVHAATDAASAMLGCRLFVPQSWDETCVPDPDGEGRQRARSPAAAGPDHPRRGRGEEAPCAQAAACARNRSPPSRVAGPPRESPTSSGTGPSGSSRWRCSTSWPGGACAPPVLIADAGYGQVAEFRQGLSDRDIRYVVATTSSTTAQPGEAVPVTKPYAGRSAPAPSPPTPTRPAA